MDEGNENLNEAPESAPEQEAPEQQTPEQEPSGHSELEMVFVLILVGLMGIAAFLGFMLLGDKVVERGDQQQAEEELVVQPVDLVSGRADKIDYLGIVHDEDIGSYFTHPTLGKTLYTAKNDCTGECLNDWAPYTTNTEYQDGDFSTTKRDDGGAFQFTWLGKALYTFNGDKKLGDFLGDGFTEGFSVARP